MPYWAKVAAASSRGYYLNWWRYGRNHEELVSEVLAHEGWTEEQWKEWRAEQLSEVLVTAARSVPYYRDLWSRLRRKGAAPSVQYIENWPVLEKESLRQNPTAFLSDDASRWRMYHEHTSGSTGTPLSLWWSKRTMRGWYALCEARMRSWYNLSRHDRWAILGGQLITKADRQFPPYWVWNSGLHQLYLSSYHLSATTVAAYLEAVESHEVRYILGYTSSIHALAVFARESGYTIPKLQAVITNAEPVYHYQRQDIEHVFQCRLYEQYGMAEIVTAASECPDGQLHQWPEVGITEVFERDILGESVHTGELLCTSLLNREMPLIRYRTGDRAIFPKEETPCRCGRTLPTISSIEGRVDDVIITPDGRLIGRMDPVFKLDVPIREAQIIQESERRIRVLVVPFDQLAVQDATRIISRIKDRVGEMHVVLEQVKAIPRSGSGKFRSVVNNMRKSSLS